MMRSRRAKTSIGVAILAVAAMAMPGMARTEGVAKGLACTFDSGISTTFEAGSFKSKPPQPLKFDITDIDLDAQSARLTTDGGGGAGSLRIIRALNANHFLEVVNEGFLNLTTVYDLDAASAAYPAVHSRHLGLVGQPVFAQYTGLCKALP